MKRNLKVFFTHFYTILSIVLFILSYGAIKVSAIYYPTDNITNPTCAPGAVGCYVSLLPDQTSNAGKFLTTNGTNTSWATITAGISSFNTRTGAITLTSGDVTGALAYTPLNKAGDTMTGALNITVPTSNVTFSGTGLNDATFSGTYGGPGNHVTVTIDSVGATDTFSYSSCCGGGSNVTITPGVSQSLIWGMSVTFNAGTGHQIGDSWTYSTSSTVLNPGPVLNISGSSGTVFFKVNAVTANSNFIGDNAGSSATFATNSNFLGGNTGAGAINAYNSNFFGQDAGNSATNANNSNFFGSAAGNSATNANNSNFFGAYAGNSATNANNSNFFGGAAGYQASSASYSNFLGNNAGYQASSASYSNFLGSSAGFNATNASYSNLLGFQAGRTFTSNNIGSNNIIIGTNISLGNAVVNSMNIGGVLFGTGFYSTTTGDPSITPVTAGKIGIVNTAPAYTLHVGSSSITGIVSRFQNSTGTCDINPTTTSLSCSSDINLKKNITTLKDNQPFVLNSQTPDTTVLKNLNKITPVIYNWSTEQDTATKQTGFIAQDVEQIFPSLVSTDPTTNLKSLNYIGLIPYAIEGIKELDIKLNQLSSLDTTLQGSFAFLLKEVLGNVSNGINELYVKVVKSDRVETKDIEAKTICLGTTCIDEEQLKQLLNQNNIQSSPIVEQSPEVIPEIVPITPEVVPEENNQTSIDIVE